MSATQILNRPTRMFPLLDAIAKEIVERTAAIASLEFHVRALHRKGASPDQLESFAPRLAGQRRSVRHAMKELEHLGWRRDARHPLRFQHPESGQEWEPGHTGFYQGLEI